MPLPALPLLLMLVLATAQQQWSFTAAAAPASQHVAANDCADADSDLPGSHTVLLRQARGAQWQRRIRQAAPAPQASQSNFASLPEGNYSTEGISYNNPTDFPVPVDYE